MTPPHSSTTQRAVPRDSGSATGGGFLKYRCRDEMKVWISSAGADRAQAVVCCVAVAQVCACTAETSAAGERQGPGGHAGGVTGAVGGTPVMTRLALLVMTCCHGLVQA